MRFVRNSRSLAAFLAWGALATQVSQVEAAELKPDFYATHRSEPFLLNRRIDPALLAAVQVWDRHLATWRTAQPAELPGQKAQVVVLHLWADWCAPCRAEFPVVRDLMATLARTYGDRVQLVLLSETSAPEAMRAVLEKERTNLPAAPHFLDYGEGVAALLRRDLPAQLSYPMTLVLDGQRIVRHAVVGPVTDRRAALLATISLLLSVPPHLTSTPAGRERSSAGRDLR